MVNQTVVSEVYSAGISAGADQKVMLALFEACLVESDFENLNHGTGTSLGVLQQEPSWGSSAERMNPGTSATKFVSRAKAIEGRYTTAGGLAQGVQVSAFPLRYQAVAPRATLLLSQASHGAIISNAANPTTSGSPLDSVAGTITSGNTWLRIAYFIAGGLLVMFALFKATGDNKLSPTTKKIVETAAMVVPK